MRAVSCEDAHTRTRMHDRYTRTHVCACTQHAHTHARACRDTCARRRTYTRVHTQGQAPQQQPAPCPSWPQFHAGPATAIPCSADEVPETCRKMHVTPPPWPECPAEAGSPGQAQAGQGPGALLRHSSLSGPLPSAHVSPPRPIWSRVCRAGPEGQQVKDAQAAGALRVGTRDRAKGSRS